MARACRDPLVPSQRRARPGLRHSACLHGRNRRLRRGYAAQLSTTVAPETTSAAVYPTAAPRPKLLLIVRLALVKPF